MAKLERVEVGEDVKRRGNFRSVGTVNWFDPESGWVRINWSKVDGETAPKICHVYELETVSEAA